MKRHNNLYEKVISIENLYEAERKARKGKAKQYGVRKFDLNKEGNLQDLHEVLKTDQYTTSRYTVFTITDPKERQIYRLPYYPDRIVHHAIMNIVEPIFVSTFTYDTYSCIKGRGIHYAKKRLERALKDKSSTEYCLKLDIKKFYPSIDHDILKDLLKRKFKDKRLLNLMYEIIDSTDGIPIGNYLSQYFANFYLSYFDHWLKEVLHVKYYFRYCDDLVILSSNKEELRQILEQIRIYLDVNLKLEVKSNWQIFPVAKRGIDFIGYKFYHTHTLLRKSIKKRFIRMIKYRDNWRSRTAYNGWLIHCNSVNLRRKYC